MINKIIDLIINSLYCFICFVIEKGYTLVTFINQHIFLKLDTSIRLEAYIGVLSILVAIVIFIVELIRDYDKVSEFQKRFILDETNIKSTTVSALIILGCYFLKQIIPFNKNVNEANYMLNIVFFSIELLMNFYIIKSIYNTIKLFSKTLKLNTDSDFYFKEYYAYVKKRLDKINNKDIKKADIKTYSNQFEEYIKSNSKYYSLDKSNFDENEYIQVKSNKSGIFKKYDIRTLQYISDKIDELNLNKKELTVNSNPIVIFLLNPGEKINHGVSIVYLRNDFGDMADELQETVHLHNSIHFQDNELNLILNDLYTFTLDDNNNSFSDNRMIMDFYNYLNDNNMRNALNLSYEYIWDLLLKSEDEKEKEKIVRILNILIMIAYSNEDYDYYKRLSNYMYYYYKDQLSTSKDIRNTIYEYTNRAFRYEYYSVKDNNDKVYYDVMMSNVLNIIFDLLEKKEFDAICDIFENVCFEHRNFKFTEAEEINDYDIIKLQFTFGFIYSLVILQNKKLFTADDVEPIKRIINYIKNNFVDIYDVEDAIYYFKKYFNKNSNVQSVYDRLDFRFVNKKYRNSWSGICIDYNFVLKAFVYLFNVNFSTDNIKHDSLASRKEKYYYESLISIMNTGITENSIEALIGLKYNDKLLLKKLNILLDKSKELENEYIRNNKINKDKFNEFYFLIVEEINKGNELINYLKGAKLIVKTKDTSRKMFGFNQVIDRDIFFEEEHYLNMLAENYGNSMITGMTKEYINKLDELSEECQSSIEEFVESVNEKEYVVITSPFNCRMMQSYNYKNKKITINEKEFDVLSDPKAKHIYVMRKQDIPKMKFNSIEEKGLQSKNKIYYKIIDCSKDEMCRKELMDNTDWIKEIGDKNSQELYLKGKCLFKLFVSIELVKEADSVIYKFKCKDDE